MKHLAEKKNVSDFVVNIFNGLISIDAENRSEQSEIESSDRKPHAKAGASLSDALQRHQLSQKEREIEDNLNIFSCSSKNSSMLGKCKCCAFIR
jgi:hypothetical protein